MQQHNCLCSHTAFRIIFKPSSLNIFLPQYISQYTSLQSNQFWLFSNPTNSFPIYFSSNTFPNISLPQYISQYAFAVSHTAFQIIFQPSRLNIFPNAFLQGGAEAKWSLCTQNLSPSQQSGPSLLPVTVFLVSHPVDLVIVSSLLNTNVRFQFTLILGMYVTHPRGCTP